MRTSRDQRSKIVGRLARLAHCVPTSRCLDKIDGGSIFSADRDRARGLESYLMIRFQAQLEPAYLLLYLVGTVPHGKELTSDKPLVSNAFVVWRLTQGRTMQRKVGAGPQFILDTFANLLEF